MDIWKHKPGDVVQVQCCDDCANRAGLPQRSRAENGVSSRFCDVCGHSSIGAQETCVVEDWLELVGTGSVSRGGEVVIYGHIPAPTIYDQNDEIATLRAEIKRLREQLAASEERAERYRRALLKLACLGNGDCYGNSHGNVIAQEALAEQEGK